MLVSLRGVKAGYGGKPAVSLDHLDIAAGGHTLLLGPSGCGKTTLLNVIAGIAPVMAGEVRIRGELIGAMSESARDRFRGAHIGLIMQRLHLIAALTVEGNLKLAQTLAGKPVDVSQIRQVLAALGVDHKLTASPRQISQGEAQRVAIARAVINNPALIIADEPTSALDDASCTVAVTLLVKQATQHGATLLVATHDARIKSHFTNVVQLGNGATQ
jgi:putative ABC transport system ATP-binding protein